MPPIYIHRCDVCKQEAEVLRPLSEWDRVPEGEEAPPAVDHEHEWKQQVGRVAVSRSSNWGTKGSWITTFLVAAVHSLLSGCYVSSTTATAKSKPTAEIISSDWYNPVKVRRICIEGVAYYLNEYGSMAPVWNASMGSFQGCEE